MSSMGEPSTVTKRLHVGGLTPAITTEHIRDRFKSFGTIEQVEDLQPDALGQARPFTFFTITTTPAQLRKCLNIMSGSTWRGTQLRLAEARPKYDARLENERSQPAEVLQKEQERKRKRAIREFGDDVGKEAQDMRPVTLKNHASKKFWKVDEHGENLIRPICMRPSHPIPSPTTRAPQGKRKPPPPRRARRRVLDPALWQRTHLTGPALQAAGAEDVNSAGPAGSGLDEWVYEEADAEGEPDELGRVQVGVWRRVRDQDQVEEEEIVRVQRRLVVPDDGEFALGIESDTASELFATAQRSASPLFGGTGVLGESSPLFGSRALPSDRQSTVPEASDGGSNVDESEANGSLAEDDSDRSVNDAKEFDEFVQSRSTSPLFPSRQDDEAPREPLRPPDDKTVQVVSKPVPPKEVAKATLPDHLVQEARAERSRELSLLAGLFGGVEGAEEVHKRKQEWRGFEESDDDEDGDAWVGGAGTGVMRLRGGMASDLEGDDEDDDEEGEGGEEEESGEEKDDEEEEEGADSDAASSSLSDDSSATMSSNSDATSSLASSSGSDVGKVKASGLQEPQPVRPKSTLKDMFAPQEADSGGFSLVAALDPDLELDDELDIPLPTVAPRQDETPLEPLAPASAKALFDPDPSVPLFFPNPAALSFTGSSEPRLSYGAGTGTGAGGDSGVGGGTGLGGGMGGAKRARDVVALDQEAPDWVGFYAQETDEEMKEIWKRDKLELTREWKRRFREGKKQRRRRGGGAGDDLD